MWVKSPSSTPYTWANAIMKDSTNGGAIPTTKCGYGDWRLPNKVEIKSLVNYGAATTSADWLMYGSGSSGFPVCNGTCFGNVPAGSYWSSSTYALLPSYAWEVNFGGAGGGSVNGFLKTDNRYVWPVRGGQ